MTLGNMTIDRLILKLFMPLLLASVLVFLFNFFTQRYHVDVSKEDLFHLPFILVPLLRRLALHPHRYLLTEVHGTALRKVPPRPRPYPQNTSKDWLLRSGKAGAGK